MPGPSISVIIPTFNRSRLIGQAIASVLAQRFTDFELIVVDDCSSDDTVSVVSAFTDPRVDLLRLGRNGGSNAARNAGIRAARAPLLSFLDSDDLYLADKLEYVAAAFAAAPALEVLVDSSLRMTSPRAKARFKENRNPVTRSTDDFAHALFRRRLSKATSAISVKQEAAIRAGLFAEDISQRQDFDFLIRLTETCNCASSDEMLWIKRWTHDRITNRERFIPATLELVRRHPQYLTNAAYRPGLARDLVRNSYFLMREGKRGAVARDLKRAADAFGIGPVAGLLANGLGQALSQLFSRRRQKPAPLEPLSPAIRSALEAEQSLG